MTRSIYSMAVAAFAFGASFAIDTQTNTAQACPPADSNYLGSVCSTAGTYCPRGYVEANGGVLPISNYQALYAVIGTTYGGDGRTTMGVPDLRGRAPVHYGQGPGLNPVPQGYAYGREFPRLDIGQMPTHSHDAVFAGQSSAVDVSVDVKASTTSATKSAPAAGDYLAAANNGERTPAPENAYIEAGQAGTTVALGGVTGGGQVTPSGIVNVGQAGNGDPFVNSGPRLSLRYCMNIDGLFPPRD